MLVKFVYISQNGNRKSLTRDESETELWRCAENFTSEFSHVLISTEIVETDEATNGFWENAE